MHIPRSFAALGLLTLTNLTSLAAGPDTRSAAPNLEQIAKTKYDLVVIGGTPGGIACALAAAREGISVLMVNHTQHIGGFMTSGCGSWEAPYDGARSPIFDETKDRISAYYKKTYGENSPQFKASIPDKSNKGRFGRPKVEPRICEMIFDEMVAAEKTLTVLKGFYVASADRQGDLLQSVVLQKMHGDERITVAARVFADCTNEGDLAAVAKVPYRIGREARAEFNEPHAGIIFTELKPEKPGEEGKNSEVKLNIRSVGGPERRQGLEILMPESTGEADPSVMSYNYRLILTKNPENRVMVQKPASYDPTKLGASSRSIVPDLQNDKIAWNGGGRLVGPQSAYPEADWATREKISQEYLDATLGWLWFYQNDPTAKPADREFWKDYGLAKDEFVDNNHVPYEVYVREARRITGRHIFTEHDAVSAAGIVRSPIFQDSVAITDWPLDSTACSDRVVRGRQEGRYMVADVWRPAQVPYRSLLPQGLDNLLVPVCLSATHVGWGTIRLEPVWMQTGEAAGIAAAIAIHEGVTPAAIDTDVLIRRLAENNHMISFFNDVDLASKSPWNPAVQFLGTRGFFSTYDANPAKPLTAAAAAQWTTLFAKLIGKDKDYDTLAAAKNLSAPEDAGTSVTTEAFVAELKKSLKERGLNEAAVDQALAAAGLPPAAPLTRGDACRVMYEVLKKS